MTIGGVAYTERKAAGQEILDACTNMKDVTEKISLGEYRGFPITLWANVQTQKFQLTLYHKLSQEVELGADAVGNTTRIDHVLDEIPKNLEKHKTALENLTAQQQEAQEEVKRPFAQAQELTDKTNRLNVLRLALHMDDGEKPQPEHTEEKPSIAECSNAWAWNLRQRQLHRADLTVRRRNLHEAGQRTHDPTLL